MEHVDLTTPASVSAPHVVAAVRTKQPRRCLQPLLPLWPPGLGLLLGAAFVGTGTGDRAARVSPRPPSLAAVSPFALRAPPSADAVLLRAQLKRKMQDWLTRTASTPVKQHG